MKLDALDARRNAPLTSPQDSDTLGWVDSMLARHMEKLANALRPVYPVHQRRTVTLPATVGAQGLANLGTVPVGRMWNLNGIIVMGADPWTAYAQPVALCIGRAQLDPTTSTTSLPDVIQPGLIAPAAYWWTDNVLWARGSDDVYVTVKAGTLGNLTVTLIYDDWPENAAAPVAL